MATKALTDTGFAVTGRQYDGMTDATITSNGSLTGGGSISSDGEYITGDSVSIAPGGSATFGSRNAGTETATGSLTLAGSQAGDYTLPRHRHCHHQQGDAGHHRQRQSATYADTLGGLTYSESGLQTGDSMNGGAGVTNENSTTSAAGTVLSHANGFDVSHSPFAIVQNTLGVSDGNGGGNYNIVYTGANLVLSAKAAHRHRLYGFRPRLLGTTNATISSNGSLTGGGSVSSDDEYITGDAVSQSPAAERPPSATGTPAWIPLPAA